MHVYLEPARLMRADCETNAGRTHDIIKGGMSDPDDVGVAACGARWTMCPTSRNHGCTRTVKM